MNTLPAKKRMKHGLSANEVEAIAKLMGIKYDYSSRWTTVTTPNGSTIIVAINATPEEARQQVVQFITQYIGANHVFNKY